jgi:tripartite-type tricarboxylate transporter receptor subunit TctC
MSIAVTRRAALAGLAALAARPVRAQAGWPARAITLVHGLAPGGPSDIIARIIAEGLARRLGQQVVVDARPGAGGRVAAGQIARTAPDGYTLMTIPSGHAVSAALYKNLPYRTIDDFSMISLLTEYPFVVVTHADHPVRTLADLISTAKSRPTPLLFGSAGNGSLQHLAGELLAKTVNATFQHVPYRGSAQAITDLLAKRIDFIVDSPAAELEFIRAGEGARAGGDRREPILQPAGDPDHGRGRHSRLHLHLLAGAGGSRGLTGRDRASSERRDRRAAGGACGHRADQDGRE